MRLSMFMYICLTKLFELGINFFWKNVYTYQTYVHKNVNTNTLIHKHIISTKFFNFTKIIEIAFCEIKKDIPYEC